MLAFKRDDDEAVINHLEGICTNLHSVQLTRSRVRDLRELVQCFLSDRSFLIIRDGFARMHQMIQMLLSENSYESIHADQLWMAQCALAARNSFSSDDRLMTDLDEHNSVFLIPLSLSMGSSSPIKRKILARESRRLAKYELETC